MTDSEIRGFYRDSKNKKTAISFLMDMTEHSKDEILEILETGEYDVSEHKKPKIKSTKRRGKVSKLDNNLVMELYEKGLKDNDIGAIVGVNGATICNWRKARGLKRNDHKFKFDTDKALELYHKGFKDSFIAEQLNIDKVSVSRWRKFNGLESNRYLKKEKAKKEILDLVQRGLSNKEISEQLGIAISTVSKYKKEFLVKNSKCKSPRQTYYKPKYVESQNINC